ncbi:helix-turn-helix domain-containing protein [Pseudonocardia sp. RS11V-5]|uniref:helix-turn-helix domain-containing protein n=1 Tax=Pseudonocardia terrae TaxID=2905831 RepID=UPI001E563F18|nr:helix-turn-helix domain-containing protein [Pseudonocardia terrae]MCE3552062.1 helix-turn-helix domain-containing protein [Pseudonocardia terrae]
MSYGELAPPAPLRGLVECLWTAGPAARTVSAGLTRVLPDGCMDLLVDGAGRLSVAGPDTVAFLARGTWEGGLRFRPGVLPRLLGVPAGELRDTRVALADVSPAAARLASRVLGSPGRPVGGDDSPAVAPGGLFRLAAELAAGEPRRETAPWSLPTLGSITARLGAGAAAGEVAAELGWSTRSLTRHCTAVYGYGPAVLRRVLRFRAAAALLHAGLAPAEVAARTGYADQPHLSREVRALAGVPTGALRPT